MQLKSKIPPSIRHNQREEVGDQFIIASDDVQSILNVNHIIEKQQNIQEQTLSTPGMRSLNI